MDKEDKAAIVRGEYVTFGHIKGRKQVTITIEFPEEMAVEIFNILGTPIAELSKPVSVCLMHPESDPNYIRTTSEMEDCPKTAFFPEAGIPISERMRTDANEVERMRTDANEVERMRTDANEVERKGTEEKSEGDKIRVMAIMLAKDKDFQAFHYFVVPTASMSPRTESQCASYIRRKCEIESRSELTTNRDAQGRFLELVDKFNGWKIEQRYGDNLNRG